MSPEATSEPEVVYHYTSMDTMMKIVETASIWATSISYLNDTSEGEHYLELIRERIPTYLQTHAVDDDSLFDKIRSRSDRNFEMLPFVASFSREDDSLPQWRSYCSNGNGVAIGFRVASLKSVFLKSDENANSKESLKIRSSLWCEQVDYVDSSRAHSLDKELDHVIRLCERAKGLLLGSSEVLKILEKNASAKKHPSFSNEREYRLLVVNPGSIRSYLRFRPTRSTLVPYVPVYFHPKRLPEATGERNDFVARVVIGPTTNEDLSHQAVSSFFKKRSMKVEVESSKIPYRDW